MAGWKQIFLPSSTQQAVALLQRLEGQAQVVAGGTDLVVDYRRGRQHAPALIDITRIPELQVFALQDDWVTIGAAVSHARLASSALLQQVAPLLAQACWQIGSPQVRNRGTLGGNLGTASPSGDCLPPLAALDAEVELVGPQGSRWVPFNQFMLDVKRTARLPTELIRQVRFRRVPEGSRSVFLKFGLRSGRSIAVVSVAVLLTLDSGWIRKARLALGAVSPRIQRSRRAESILLGQPPTDAVFELAAQAAAEDCAPISDLRATADYRRRLVKALTRRALELCREDRAPQVRLGVTPFVLGSPEIKALEGVGAEPLTEVRCRVNGVETVWPAAGLTLLQALRSIGLQHGPLTGTKEGCAEGECGACTVLLDDQAVLACLTPAAAAHGRSVRTVEGLAQGEKLSALQNAFIQAGAVQCGYCTPGLLMSGTALLENYPDPTPEQIREALSGNLCRCTGYTMLVEAVTAAAHSQEVET